MSLPWSAALVVVCALGAPASAERAIEVELTTAAPFRADELAAAMRMRLPAAGPAVHVRVTTLVDRIRVEAAVGTRDVALEGRAGAAAARLVALAATDLLLEDLAVAPELVLRPPSAVPRTRVAAGEGPAVGVLGSASGWSGVLAAGAVELVIPRAGFLVAGELSGGALVAGKVGLIAALARLDLGVRLGLLELRGGVTLAPVEVRTGAGDRTLLAGGNASARIRVPLIGSTRGVLAAGVDVFATRTSYLLDGAVVTTTPRIAPWIAAGMELAL